MNDDINSENEIQKISHSTSNNLLSIYMLTTKKLTKNSHNAPSLKFIIKSNRCACRILKSSFAHNEDSARRAELSR